MSCGRSVEASASPCWNKLPAPLHVGGAAGVDLNCFLIPEEPSSVSATMPRWGGAAAAPSTCCFGRVLPQRHAHRRQAAALVSGAQRYDDHYDDYVGGLFARQGQSQDDWLDLGGFDRISCRGVFRLRPVAALQGDRLPYKAVLKSVLMAYSHGIPTPGCCR